MLVSLDLCFVLLSCHLIGGGFGFGDLCGWWLNYCCHLECLVCGLGWFRASTFWFPLRICELRASGGLWLVGDGLFGFGFPRLGWLGFCLLVFDVWRCWFDAVWFVGLNAVGC